MSIQSEIQKQVVEAMKAKDNQRRDALRFILSALKAQEKDKRRELSQEEEFACLTREAKKRREAIESFRAASQDDKADKEQYELDLIQTFLPKPFSPVEVRDLIIEIAKELDLSNEKERNSLMKHLMPKIQGRFPGNEAKKLVDDFLLK